MGDANLGTNTDGNAESPAPAAARADEIAIGNRARELLDRCKALQDEASAHSSRMRAESVALSQQALALDVEIKNLHRDTSKLLDKELIEHRVAEKVEEDLYRARSMIYEGDVAALLPHKANGTFLRLILGPVNVRATGNDVRFKVKEEYNAYRDRTAVLFLAFPCILLLMKHFWWSCFPALPVQAYQAWLLFFYTSLALRENILRVNGSDIRPWWVYHHYFAMLTAVISLTWGVQDQPSCVRKQKGVQLFLYWAVMQGVSMLLQNRYQRQRLYTRIALGKAGRMDVVWGETAGMKGQLCVLYPVLFMLQGFQLWIAKLLLITPMREKDYEWQMVACGLLLLIMASGNFVNTLDTVWTKTKIKKQMRLQRATGNAINQRKLD